MANRALSAWLWTALLLILCLLPRDLTPEASSVSLSARLPHADKVVHLGLFAGFGVFWNLAAGSGRRWPMILLAGALLAVGTELAQSLPVIGRDPDLVDGLADTAGLVGGIVFCRLLSRAPVAEAVPE